MSTKRLSTFSNHLAPLVNNDRFPMITAIGTVNANAKWDLIKTSLKADFGLTDAVIAQISNIGSTTISSSQWEHLGVADQDTHTTANVTFNGVAVSDAGLRFTVNNLGVTIENNVPLIFKSIGFFDGEIRVDASDKMLITDPGSGIQVNLLTNFEFNSTVSGMIVSRLTTAQKNAMPFPANGMIIYDTTLHKLQKYENGGWLGTEANATFAGLTDVSGAYTTGTALWRTNAGATGMEELTTLVTEPSANEFKIVHGSAALYMDHDLFIGGSGATAMSLTGDLTLSADLNVESTSRINQDLTSDATPTFAGATLTSTTQALIVPRMTTAQKNALSGVNGMIIYDTTLNKFQGYENGAWTSFI